MNRLLVQNRRAYHRTTNSNHRFYCHLNRVKEGLIPERPEQLWVADINYLATRRGCTYLSLVTDAHSRKIVGCHLSDNMKACTVKLAFLNALKGRKNTGELVITQIEAFSTALLNAKSYIDSMVYPAQ